MGGGVKWAGSMTPFERFRRGWAAILLAAHWSCVLTYMAVHIRHRKHIAVLQVGPSPCHVQMGLASAT